MITKGDLVKIVDNATGEVLQGRVTTITSHVVKVRLTCPESMKNEIIMAFRLPPPDGIKDCYIVLED